MDDKSHKSLRSEKLINFTKKVTIILTYSCRLQKTIYFWLSSFRLCIGTRMVEWITLGEGIRVLTTIFSHTVCTRTTTIGLVSRGTRSRGIRCVRRIWCVSISTIPTSITTCTIINIAFINSIT